MPEALLGNHQVKSGIIKTVRVDARFFFVIVIKRFNYKSCEKILTCYAMQLFLCCYLYSIDLYV